MDKASVAEMARQIAYEQAVLNWKFYFVLGALQLLVFAATIYIGAYLKKRGETFATRADFIEIKGQLAETTSLTKGIEISLSHSDWWLKENKMLKRSKIEECLTSLYSSQDWLYQQMEV